MKHISEVRTHACLVRMQRDTLKKKKNWMRRKGKNEKFQLKIQIHLAMYYIVSGKKVNSI